MLRPDSPFSPSDQMSSWVRLLCLDSDLIGRYHSGDLNQKRVVIFECILCTLVGLIGIGVSIWMGSKPSIFPSKFVGTLDKSLDPLPFWAWSLFPSFVGLFFLYKVLRFIWLFRNKTAENTSSNTPNRSERRKREFKR